MPSQIIIDDDIPVYVELTPIRGEREVSLNPEGLIKKSTEGLNSAFTSILGMTQRMVSTVKAMPLTDSPDEIQLQFALKIDVSGNSYIVKGGAEAQINVNLVWKKQNTTEHK